jgi:hypothetical protein
MKRRLKAWKMATEIVNPIIEQHGVEDISAPGSAPFITSGKITKVEQHITHIMTVADWLLIEEE